MKVIKDLAISIAMCLSLLVISCSESIGGPSEAEERFNSGVNLQEQGRLEEAIGEYDKTIRLDSQHASAYNNRGGVYNELGQHERAIKDLDKAISLDPQLASAYKNRGNTYRKLGQHERAIQD